MGSTPPPNRPSFAEENAMRIASESISYYDEQSDTYHCSYGPPAPAFSVHDTERDVMVRVDPHTRQVLGFSIPNFKQWHAAHAEEDGAPPARGAAVSLAWEDAAVVALPA